MREIKFRALKDDMSNCRFYYGSLIYDKIGQPRIHDLDVDLFHTCIKGTEGQFTGLKDKNGKEIYEGDVANTADGELTLVFYDGCFFAENDNFGAPAFSYTDNNNIFDGEIIGNIHDS